MGTLRPLWPKEAKLVAGAQIANLAKHLSGSGTVTILSGAGISTESGLSDYRSPGKTKPVRPPINHNEFVSSTVVRKRYWARSFVGYPVLSSAQPNLCHHALSALHGRLDSVFRYHVTQNVDGLLQAAHTPKDCITELHGSIHWLMCRRCGVTEAREIFQNRLLDLNENWSGEVAQFNARPDGDAELEEGLVHQFQVPNCRFCGEDGLMPRVVFHGGQVPNRDSEMAAKAIEECDALLIIGSTVTPYSAFRLAKMAKKRGCFLGCINFGATRADDLLDIKVEGLAGDALTRLANLLLTDGFQPPESYTQYRK